MRQTTLDELGTWWHIRITLEELTMELTQSIFEAYDKYIISEEGGDEHTKLHHHITIDTEEDSKQIKDRIRKVYPNAKNNKCIYTKPVKDKRQVAKYTLKEGNYIYKGFTDDFIKEHFKLSVAKTDLKKDITQLEEEYILDKITTKQFTERYIDLKVKHDQPLYSNHIVAYIRKMMIRSGNMKARDYAQNILAQVEYKN